MAGMTIGQDDQAASWQRWTARAPRVAGVLVVLALLVAGWNVVTSRRDAAAAADARELVSQIEILLSAMKDLETGERGFLLTGEEQFLEPYHWGSTNAAAAMGRIGALAPDVAARLRTLVQAKQDFAAQVIARRRAVSIEAAIGLMSTDEDKRRMDAVRVAAAREQEAGRAQATALEAREAVRGPLLTGLSLLLVLTACGFLAAYALIRRRAERRAATLLEGVMENAPVGLGFFDDQLHLRHGNRALARINEGTLGLAVGSGLDSLLAEIRAQVEPPLRAVLETGETRTNVLVRARPPGERPDAVRHLVLGFFPLQAQRADGPVAGAGMVAQDVTEQHRAEARVRSSEAQFRGLANALPQLAWSTGPDGAINWYNQRFYDYTGLSEKQLLGMGWRNVHHPDYLEGATERYLEAVRNGAEWEDTFPLRGRDGQYRWFLSRATPIREAPDTANSEGRLLGYFGTNTDVTAMRDAEEALETARAGAEEANRAKSQFIANMSHELRTPLSAVIGYAEMLEEEVAEMPGGEAVLGDLRRIHGNARHLLSLINDVLDLSKIEAGHMEVSTEDVDGAALLREVAGTVRSLVDKKQNTLVLQVPDDLGPLHTDVVKVRQCLFNLISNAAKFTENGRITLTASREAREDGDWLTLGIADTGIGMTEEQLAKLFQRFTQADASTTRKFGGTGLGLSITRAFCTMLGGDIGVESTPGQGTTFTIRIPADLRPAPDDVPEQSTLSDVPSENRVLVIDDDAPTREMLTRFLHREGFAVQSAADGESGLRLARELRPCTILLDVMMPRMDGWAVLSRLKADPELADIPVVMVTFVTDRGLGFSLGAAEYLTKPVEWTQLKRVLDRLRCHPEPQSVLVVDADAEAAGALHHLLEGESWRVEEAADAATALARIREAVPGAIIVSLRTLGADGFTFLNELRRTPGWRQIPVIALADEEELTAAQRERLRAQVQQVMAAEGGPPAELAEELRRLAGSRACAEP